MEPYQAVGAVVARDDEVLLLQRKSGIWQFVTGGKEEGEGDREALHREIKEETGLEDFRVEGSLGSRRFTTSSGNEVEVSQFLVEAPDGDVRIEHNPDDEHKDWGWFSFKEARELLEFEDQVGVLEKARDAL